MLEKKGTSSEYPATNLPILSTLYSEENRNKKNLVICKLVAGYSEVQPKKRLLTVYLLVKQHL